MNKQQVFGPGDAARYGIEQLQDGSDRWVWKEDLTPTPEEETTTKVIGFYRSGTGPGPNDYHLCRVYGAREWKFGAQVLVNSIGGRAWINGCIWTRARS